MALLFLSHGTRRRWGVSVTPRPLFTPGKDTLPIAQDAEWAPGPVWTGAENLAPAGIFFLNIHYIMSLNKYNFNTPSYGYNTFLDAN